MQPFIPEVLRVMRILAKPLDDVHVYAHVGKETHVFAYEIFTCS